MPCQDESIELLLVVVIEPLGLKLAWGVSDLAPLGSEATFKSGSNFGDFEDALPVGNSRKTSCATVDTGADCGMRTERWCERALNDPIRTTVGVRGQG